MEKKRCLFGGQNEFHVAEMLHYQNITTCSTHIYHCSTSIKDCSILQVSSVRLIMLVKLPNTMARDIRSLMCRELNWSNHNVPPCNAVFLNRWGVFHWWNLISFVGLEVSKTIIDSGFSYTKTLLNCKRKVLINAIIHCNRISANKTTLFLHNYGNIIHYQNCYNL
jgi:hypothetical protein